MSRIRVERTSIEGWLGFFGADHLLLTYEPAAFVDQVDWYGMEGARVFLAGSPTPVLQVAGANGTTTLATLNVFLDGTRYVVPNATELANMIGTPQERGSRALPFLDPDNAWSTMAGYARLIDQEAFPYTATTLTFTASAALNSTSLIASLLHYAGTDLSANLPFGLGFSPGRETLLGTGGNEELRIENGFTSIYGGGGTDTFYGSDDPSVRERFYGGKADDIFNWSKGSNVYHGGQKALPYANDGIDTVVYDEIGPFYVRLPSIDHIPHYNAEFVVEHTTGEDWLLSIERLEWRDKSDFITLGPGVDLIQEGLDFHLGAEAAADPAEDRGDIVDFAQVGGGLLLNAVNADTLFAQFAQSDAKGLWLEEAEWVIGTDSDDRIYLTANMRGGDGGGGNDLIDGRLAAAGSGLTAEGATARLEGGAGNDIIVSTAGMTVAKGGAGNDTFVLSSLTGMSGSLGNVEFTIEDAGSDDRLFVPYSFFTETPGDFEGSELLPLLGAIGTFEDMRDNGYVLPFEWRLEEHLFYGTNYTQGIIDFVGSIEYVLDGDDLVVSLFQGETFEVPVYDENGQLLHNEVLLALHDDETKIRVTDFQPGDLGIEFHDPGEGTNISLPNGQGATTYPNFDAAVNTLTNGGVLTDPLDPRPQAPTSNPNHDDETSDADLLVADGTSGNDVITAVSSADHAIHAGAGDDVVVGGDGNDLLDGGSGDDTLQGGNGNDSYVVDSASDIVVEVADAGTDSALSYIDITLAANLENLTLMPTALEGTGNNLDNILTGNDAANILSGGGGNDTLVGAAGDDTLIGGEGSDTYTYSSGDGDDLIRDTGSAVDTDTLYLSGYVPAEVRAIRHEGADDDLQLLLSDGALVTVEDYFAASGAGIEVIGFDLDPALNRNDINALAAASGIVANTAPQAVADSSFSVYGSDILIPAAALLENDRDVEGDTLTIVAVGASSLGTATLLGNGDIELLVPTGTEDVVTFTYTVADPSGATSTADVSLLVGPENVAPAAVADGSIDIARDAATTLVASQLLSNDNDPEGSTLTISTVANAIAGSVTDNGDGTVTFTPDAGYTGPASFTYTASDGITESTPATVDVMVHDVTTITGTDYNDAIFGTAEWETIVGLGGSDEIFGGAGQDVIEGGDGNDTLHGGDDHDTLIGGNNGDALYGNSGNDTLDGGSGVDVLFGGDGDDVLVGGKSGDTLVGGAGDDNVYGGDGADTIDGGDGDDIVLGEASGDTIIGGSGNDLLFGGGGYDNLDGGDGADRLYGDAGNDSLAGGTGDDVLEGGTGTDNLDGGLGDDILFGDQGADTFVVSPGGGHDTILDFEWGTGGTDRLDVAAVGLTSLAEVGALATEANGDTVLLIDSGTSVRLLGVTVSDLHEGDFYFA